MVICTFSGTTVPSREITKINQTGNNAGTIYKFEVTVACRTTSYSTYAALAALAGVTEKVVLLNGKTSVQTIGGTSGSLVLNGVTYTNCYIENISAAEVSRSNLGVWDFTVSFVKDTSV